VRVASNPIHAIRKDFPFNVEESLTGRQSGDDSFELRSKLVRKIASQLFGNLAGIHYWNVVHRDIKGSNLVLAEKGRRFKLSEKTPRGRCGLEVGTEGTPSRPASCDSSE
jgi:serine/threonine protein kinase